jgi:hypothetical protein
MARTEVEKVAARKASQKRWNEKHREQYLEITRENSKRFREKHPDRAKGYKLNGAYGPGAAKHYSIQEVKQGFRCAICGDTNPSGKRLALDHNHDTGKLRGLLCSRCNAMVGMCKENPEILISAVSYLTEWNDGEKN